MHHSSEVSEKLSPFDRVVDWLYDQRSALTREWVKEGGPTQIPYTVYRSIVLRGVVIEVLLQLSKAVRLIPYEWHYLRQSRYFLLVYTVIVVTALYAISGLIA